MMKNADASDSSLLNQKAALAAAMTIGPGDEAPETPAETFVRICLKFIRDWHKTHPRKNRVKQTKPAMFVFKAGAFPKDVVAGSQSQPGFRQARDLSLGGSVFVCNENLKSVFSSPLNAKTGPEALVRLGAAPLLGCTAVVLLPSQEAVLIHRADEDPDETTRIDFGAGGLQPFQFSKLDIHLYEFWQRYTKFSTGYCDIWSEVGNRVLKPQPERQIQRSLMGYFFERLGTQLELDQEVFTRQGRTDVRLMLFQPHGKTEIVILELKVLRNSPDPIKWALSGVTQIEGYRSSELQPNRVILDCYLCCYDARKTRTHIADIAEPARAAKVKLRRYFMQTTTA